MSKKSTKKSEKKEQNKKMKVEVVNDSYLLELSQQNQKVAEEIKNLSSESRKLAKEVKKLKNLEFIQAFKKPWKLAWLSFLRGVMIGFGSVIGASVVVALFIYILSKISFIPVLGDFVQQIIQEIQPVANN